VKKEIKRPVTVQHAPGKGGVVKKTPVKAAVSKKDDDDSGGNEDEALRIG